MLFSLSLSAGPCRRTRSTCRRSPCFTVGGTNVCLGRFDAATVYDAIHIHGVTHLFCALVVLNMLASAPDTARKPLPGRSVHIVMAVAPPPAPMLRCAEALGYGLTETAGLPVSCVWRGEWDEMLAAERARLKARQGVSTPGMVEVDVADGGCGKSVARDGSSMGVIVLRGGCLMLGYLKDDEGTRKAILPNVLHSKCRGYAVRRLHRDPMASQCYFPQTLAALRRFGGSSRTSLPCPSLMAATTPRSS